MPRARLLRWLKRIMKLHGGLSIEALRGRIDDIDAELSASAIGRMRPRSPGTSMAAAGYRDGGRGAGQVQAITRPPTRGQAAMFERVKTRQGAGRLADLQ